MRCGVIDAPKGDVIQYGHFSGIEPDDPGDNKRGVRTVLAARKIRKGAHGPGSELIR